MKLFREYYENSQKAYKYKVRIADDVTSEMLDAMEQALAPFSLVSMGKPRTLPIQENPTYFENLGPVPVNIVEVEVAYPTTPDHIRELVAKSCKVGVPHVFVTTEGQEHLQMTRIKVDKDGKPILTQEYEDSPADVKKLYGDENIEITLKAINKKKFHHQFEKPSGEVGKTLSDEPINNTSPIGTHQNKIPDPMKRNQ